MNETFTEFCKNSTCKNCEVAQIIIRKGGFCEETFMQMHDEKVRADAIEELKEACVEKMEEIRKEYFRITKGHVMPERKTYIMMSDVMGIATEIVLIKAKQLKEKKE